MPFDRRLRKSFIGAAERPTSNCQKSLLEFPVRQRAAVEADKRAGTLEIGVMAAREALNLPVEVRVLDLQLPSRLA